MPATGMFLEQKLGLSRSLVLSQTQRFSLRNRLFELRMELIKELRGEKFIPKGKCPKCGRELTPIEIIRGFNQDPNDFTTACSGCGERFKPIVICHAGEGIAFELPFYCPCQTLEQMQGKEIFSPEQLCRQHPAIYRSAIVHYGGIKKAFSQIGIAYPFEEISDWKSKVMPFLGRLSDVVIAGCVGVNVQIIRNLRKNMGIARYVHRKAAEEAGII